MPFVKTVKNKSYYKRFQTKYRRRREGKTDYYARKRLVLQDKNKYNTPKYRFVVRSSNRDVVCQVVYAKLCGDVVLAAAYSHELPRYGVKVGLTNYAATYCTGLLCARRMLSKFGLAEAYVGKAVADGTFFEVERGEGPAPFRANLDVGLVRTTTGTKVFAAMKGANDGGMLVPHSEKRFVGYDSESKKLNPEILKKYIYGGHVAEYMRLLEEEDPEKYRSHFSRFVKEGVTADMLEDMYKTAHEKIRADPLHVKKPVKPMKERKCFKEKRLTYEQRKERVAKKKAILGINF